MFVVSGTGLGIGLMSMLIKSTIGYAIFDTLTAKNFSGNSICISIMYTFGPQFIRPKREIYAIPEQKIRNVVVKIRPFRNDPRFLIKVYFCSSLGWRLGLQGITGTLSITFILGTFYRSASLYHPQRRAILHIKNQKRKIRDKNRIDDKPPFFDLTALRSTTVRILLFSTAVTSFGISTPLFYLAYHVKVEGKFKKVKANRVRENWHFLK